MEKRRVTVTIGGQRCSFLSDDSDTYIAALEKKANEVMRQTAPFSGFSPLTNAVLSVVFLTDELMRENKGKTEKPEDRDEPRQARKGIVRVSQQEKGQVSIWELMEDGSQKKA